MQDEERTRKALEQYLGRLRSLNRAMGAVIVLLFLSLFFIIAISLHAK